jgi:hypothetical protein
MTVAGHAVPGYKVMQYGSTAVGLPLLAALAIVWLSRQSPVPLDSLPSVSRTARLAALLVALGIPAALTRPVWGGGRASVYDRVGQSIRDSGLALMIAVLAYCLAFRAVAARRGESVRTLRSERGDSSRPPSPSHSP